MAYKGIKFTKEHKRNISEARKGKKLSEETKMRISNKLKGHIVTEKTRQKIRLANIGKKLSEEAKRKVSEANKGNIPWNKGKIGSHSKESRKKMSDFHTGKKLSKETKMKISNKSRKMWESEEYRMKMKKIMREIWTKKKYRMKMSIIRQGEKNPAWLGGKSYEPYTPDFNKRFKELIKERDNNKCQLCNLFENDNIKLYKKGLTIHHIDYDKKNSFTQNCITLCTRCNSLVNKDREIWTKHFQELLKKLYNYEYTIDQKIILDFNKRQGVK